MIRLIFLFAFLLTVCASNVNRIGRIVGGQLAVENQFPYIASLRVRRFQEHSCGASILNERWLVSAAHCTLGFEINDLYIAVGLLKRSGGGITHDIERVINHNFNWNTFENDVCTIRTVNRIIFSPSVQPIPLGSDLIGGGVRSVVSGWGLTRDGGSLSPDLLWLEKLTITNEKCREHFGSMIVASTLCAGGVDGVGQGVCNSDSGGPLTANGRLIGIVNFGMVCGSGVPDGYARVSHFRPWILSNSVV